MIKIIEKGNRFYKKKCPQCECVFLYEREDVENVTRESIIGPDGRMYDSYSYPYYGEVSCPFCQKVIGVNFELDE